MALKESVQLRQGQRRAEEVRRLHGGPNQLNEHAQHLIGEPAGIGLAQLFEKGKADRRQLFGKFLDNRHPLPQAQPGQLQHRPHTDPIGRIQRALALPDDVKPEDRNAELQPDDLNLLLSELQLFNQNMDVSEACVKHIDPAALRGFFPNNPNLERLFAGAGNEVELKKAVRGMFEWAAIDQSQIGNLYTVLNHFSEYKTAEGRFTTVRGNKMLSNMSKKYKTNVREIQMLRNPNATYSENVSNLYQHLRDHGKGVISSWLGAHKLTGVQDLVSYLSRDQETAMNEIAQICDHQILANGDIFAGAIDTMVRGTAAERFSPVVSPDTYGVVWNACRNDRVGSDVSADWIQHLRNSSMQQNNDRAFQQNFLQDYRRRKVRGGGFGFLNWLIGNDWGQQEDDILNNERLNGITVPQAPGTPRAPRAPRAPQVP